ncbi:LOW QUALITY PROTEIN: hypothetical protein Cgig2_012466 [Carnegiea gigantea]|uniref:Uncharacterized protein n=1 Tax=Carnegiea gigantea TaxID=171969 RepID=A0A9Q1KMN1_9CARY|nr:LOW QUALITY PROTEIN: hypothetical protein Cgig2_012466 [Carnegiea gigantea]
MKKEPSRLVMSVPNMNPLPTLMEEDQLRAYIPSRPNSESFQNQPLTIKDMGNISVLGLVVSAWQELWRDSSPISTPSPISQGAPNEGGGDGKGKRTLESSSLEPNKSSKTTSSKRMGRAMMYEKLESMMEVIILEKKEREVEREERRIEREERKAESKERKVE